MDTRDPDAEYRHWDFSSYWSVREQNIGEVVYLQRWQELMLSSPTGYKDGTSIDVDRYFLETYPEEFPILSVLPARQSPLNEHHTRLATTFIHALTRNVLRDFIETAENLRDQYDLPKEDAYVLAWAQRNVRKGYCNYGLVPKDIISDIYGERIPAQSVEDTETLEQVVRWLASEAGQTFIKGCEDELERRRRPEWKISPEPVFQLY